MGHSNSVAQPVPHALPLLPEEVWLLIFGLLDETTKAICMHVCPEWRRWILELTRLVVPRIFAPDLICSISLLQWQQDVLGRPITRLTPAEAAMGGHLHILQYLHAINCPWDEITCSFAAAGGHLDILKYARRNGCPWDDRTCFEAAKKGHLDILKFAHTNGCPGSWDNNICAVAAMNGQLDCFVYACTNGFAFNAFDCLNAAICGGHFNLLVAVMYYNNLSQIRIIFPKEFTELCTLAAQYGSLNILQYLHTSGYHWNANTFLCAKRSGHLHILEYLRSNGCPE